MLMNSATKVKRLNIGNIGGLKSYRGSESFAHQPEMLRRVCVCVCVCVSFLLVFFLHFFWWGGGMLFSGTQHWPHKTGMKQLHANPEFVQFPTGECQVRRATVSSLFSAAWLRGGEWAGLPADSGSVSVHL